MIEILALFIRAISQLLVLLVIVSVILSYFLDPYHPIRRSIDSIVEPLLAPIRRIVPNIGFLDLSPLILIILLQLLSNIIVSFLLTLR
ncbi:MAG TPA: YggT family protein [Anaerolineales bacterium]|nr:YggT family protein [Anaerolineales bacterium]